MSQPARSAPRKKSIAPSLLLGIAVVATFGIMNVVNDETRIRIFSRLTAGAGPATVTAEVQPPIGDPPPRKDDRPA